MSPRHLQNPHQFKTIAPRETHTAYHLEGITTCGSICQVELGSEFRRSVWVVIISGAGKAFRAGGDIKEAGMLEALGTEELWDSVAIWNKMGYRVKCLELPTIAALHGYVLGGGFLLAACCDIRIAAEDTEMALVERRN